VRRFDPVADSNARVLILGTLPSEESLKRREYYANKTNRFWRIMGELAGGLPEMGYDDRLQKLKQRGIALWDVCLSAERSGSLDSKIVMSTVVPNDFGAFLHAHPYVCLICFNGLTAEKIFRRKVTANVSDIRCELLPSSSSAHAVTHQQKLSRWHNILESAIIVN
jgi:hypoxanthine-DNA glycosylase